MRKTVCWAATAACFCLAASPTVARAECANVMDTYAWANCDYYRFQAGGCFCSDGTSAVAYEITLTPDSGPAIVVRDSVPLPTDTCNYYVIAEKPFSEYGLAPGGHFTLSGVASLPNGATFPLDFFGLAGITCANPCPAEQASCAGLCVDVASDAAHCGTCGSACPSGQSCQGGVCVPACPAGSTECDGACVDLASEEAHCGACGNACAAGDLCQGGACQPTQPRLTLSKTASEAVVPFGEPVTYTYVVTNVGTEPLTGVTVKDDGATPEFAGDDFVAATFDSLAVGESRTVGVTALAPQRMCTRSYCSTQREAGTLIAQWLPSGDVRVVYRQSRSIADNTYGAGASGWLFGHRFYDLLGGDRAEFRFTDSAGRVVLDFFVDYLSASSAHPSGYGTLGVAGGDGRMVVGSAANVLSVKTTLSSNLNQSPAFHGFTTHSPAPEDAYPAWDYVDGYEVVVSKAAFGTAGFGGVTVPVVYNTPSKIGAYEFLPAPCPSCAVNLAEATGSGAVSGTQASAEASAKVCYESSAAGCTSGTSSIRADFNAIPIAAGRTVWFSAVVAVSGRNGAPATLVFDDAKIEFVAGSTPVTIAVPKSVITFDAQATRAATTFVDGTWKTVVPVGYTGNVLLSAVAYQAPTDLPGGIKGVTWSGAFTSPQTGLSAAWKWSAAVYSAFSSDYTLLGVKPVGSAWLSAYPNSDHAGTPEQFKWRVIAGARGYGLGNFTGWYGASARLTPCLP